MAACNRILNPFGVAIEAITDYNEVLWQAHYLQPKSNFSRPVVTLYARTKPYWLRKSASSTAVCMVVALFGSIPATIFLWPFSRHDDPLGDVVIAQIIYASTALLGTVPYLKPTDRPIDLQRPLGVSLFDQIAAYPIDITPSLSLSLRSDYALLVR